MLIVAELHDFQRFAYIVKEGNGPMTELSEKGAGTRGESDESNPQTDLTHGGDVFWKADENSLSTRILPEAA